MITKFWNSLTGRYLVIGGGSAVSNILLLIIFDSLFGAWLNATAIYVLSAVVGLLITYVLQRNFVWRSTAAIHREAAKFLTVASVVFVFNLCGIYFFVQELKFPLILTQCVLMVCFSGVTFLSSKYWTFRSTHHKKIETGSDIHSSTL